MSDVCLRRYGYAPGDGDLTEEDLLTLFGVMVAEKLVGVTFHDGSITNWDEFRDFATSTQTWFYAFEQDGIFIGFAYFTGFSSSGNTAFMHYCCFREGRAGGFSEGLKRIEDLMLAKSALVNVIGVTPKRYRAANKVSVGGGFKHAITLPGCYALKRGDKTIISDAVVRVKTLQRSSVWAAAEEAKAEAKAGAQAPNRSRKRPSRSRTKKT
jgi:hypothetical protein